MGPSSVHGETVKQGVLSSYTVKAYQARLLPSPYQGLVYSKWLRSLRYGNDYFKLVDPDAYYRAYHKYITTILAWSDSVVRLAVLSEDPDVVLGFSVARGKILDYVHVHKHQRRMGIGTSLIPSGIDTISHVTKTGLSIWGSKYGHWLFNPFA